MKSTPAASRAGQHLRARELCGAVAAARAVRHSPFTPSGGLAAVRVERPASWGTAPARPGTPRVSITARAETTRPRGAR